MKTSDWVKLIRLASQRFNFIWRKPSATVEYPFVSRQTGPHVRAGLRNDFSQCTGCIKCEQRCPVACIHIQSEDFPEDQPRPQTSQGVAFERKITSYVIDFNRCLFCGLCVEI